MVSMENEYQSRGEWRQTTKPIGEKEEKMETERWKAKTVLGGERMKEMVCFVHPGIGTFYALHMSSDGRVFKNDK